MRTIHHDFLPRFWHFFDADDKGTIHIDPHPASLSVYRSTPLSPLLTSVDLESPASGIRPFVFNRRMVIMKVADTVFSRHGELGLWIGAAQSKRPLMCTQVDNETRRHINVLDMLSLSVHDPHSDGLRMELLPSSSQSMYHAAILEVHQPWAAYRPGSTGTIKTFGEEPHTNARLITQIGLSQLQICFVIAQRMDVYSHQDMDMDRIHLIQTADPSFISEVYSQSKERLDERSAPRYRALSPRSEYFVIANTEQVEL
ncbi:hypothetical protein CONPUDRAFT_168280 [Coniophora puteana RWD-64-598 SS2]|uniref:Uncharacterized protein n=1 Tax=Coniophora puteana (strain RWD-64-598) TaxID=741705 RepID=A0A5M3MDX6_CONPW|nr:uncharacterized protein CONPUDRAFT_168280 [Coniophora puteana RWD-64-598 SS2]EIW77333.1 hypothetical protein CONPUDRAFT_168280 [Coniophora puteana RWD-64-598 SS2]